MANIDVDIEQVNDSMQTIKTTHANLEKLIKELDNRKKMIPQYWVSKEASDFASKVDAVYNALNDFCTSNKAFIDSANNLMSNYSDQENNILSAINASSNK